jgi:hypothetical protein
VLRSLAQGINLEKRLNGLPATGKLYVVTEDGIARYIRPSDRWSQANPRRCGLTVGCVLQSAQPENWSKLVSAHEFLG